MCEGVSVKSVSSVNVFISFSCITVINYDPENNNFSDEGGAGDDI